MLPYPASYVGSYLFSLGIQQQQQQQQQQRSCSSSRSSSSCTAATSTCQLQSWFPISSICPAVCHQEEVQRIRKLRGMLSFATALSQSQLPAIAFA